MYLPNLKSVALPVPELIGGSPKIWGGPWICQYSLYSPEKSYTPVIQTIPLYVHSFSRNFRLEFRVGGCEPPILGKAMPQGVGEGTIRKRIGKFL